MVKIPKILLNNPEKKKIIINNKKKILHFKMVKQLMRHTVFTTALQLNLQNYKNDFKNLFCDK